MDEVLDEALVKDHKPAWKGGDQPYEASYGKLMMWFFLITDTLTFSAFLASYGFSRFKYPDIWPNLKMYLVTSHSYMGSIHFCLLP